MAVFLAFLIKNNLLCLSNKSVEMVLSYELPLQLKLACCGTDKHVDPANDLS